MGRRKKKNNKFLVAQQANPAQETKPVIKVAIAVPESGNVQPTERSSHHHHHHKKKQRFILFRLIPGENLSTRLLIGIILVFIGVVIGDILSGQQGSRGIVKTVDQIVDTVDPMGDIRRSFQLLLSRQEDILNGLFVGERVKPGENLAKMGAKAKYPTVLIPGIVTSKLELWEGRPGPIIEAADNKNSATRTKSCAGNFRSYIWGGAQMIQSFLLRRQCWIDHICLNTTTGLDPDGIKVRAGEGFSAADFLIGDFWVWEPVIRNLADVGYNPNNMKMMAYDWRLSFQNMEKRDSYFTRLKFEIELLHRTNQQKVVMIAHSMGANLVLYFLQWVEKAKGGNGGPSWVNDHIQAFVNIGGPILGVPKSISSIISGEMRDTADLPMIFQMIKENFLSKKELRSIFRSFGCLPTMFPKGGHIIWGNDTYAADDFNTSKTNFGLFLNLHEDDLTLDKEELDAVEISQWNDTESSNFTNSVAYALDIKKKHYTTEDVYELLRKVAPAYMRREEFHQSFGVAFDLDDPKYDSFKYWTNPLESRLPNATNMKIFCLYGFGKPTERNYRYRFHEPDLRKFKDAVNEWIESHNKTFEPNEARNFMDGLMDDLILMVLRGNVTTFDNLIVNGVGLTDGDGTVPLLSAGFMCVDGWKRKTYNPHKIDVVTREYLHAPVPLLSINGVGTSLVRGGNSTADHVDIMGNFDMISDLVKIVTGFNEVDLSNKILSNIRNISRRVVGLPP